MDLDYAALTEACALLAGRLPDDSLSSVRDFYAAGEWQLGDDTLLMGLAYYGVGITDAERELLRSFLGDPYGADLNAVPALAEVPPIPYRFSPAGGPDPAAVDAFLTAEAARRGYLRLYRAWREPLPGAPDGATWVYLVRVPEGTDELKAHSGLGAQLRAHVRAEWWLEVIAEGAPATPYQGAALAAAHPVWTV
jgi:hypothetical protein